jgi:hypothetical protein
LDPSFSASPCYQWVLGGFWLVITVCLRAAVITKYRACGVWVFATLWGTLLQLTVFPFKWIDKIMEDMAEKVEQMLNKEASHRCTLES